MINWYNLRSVKLNKNDITEQNLWNHQLLRDLLSRLKKYNTKWSRVNNMSIKIRRKHIKSSKSGRINLNFRIGTIIIIKFLAVFNKLLRIKTWAHYLTKLRPSKEKILMKIALVNMTHFVRTCCMIRMFTKIRQKSIKKTCSSRQLRLPSKYQKKIITKKVGGTRRSGR